MLWGPGHDWLSLAVGVAVTFMAQTLNTLGFTNACNQPEAQVDAISLSSAYGLYLTLKAVIDDRV